jgi:hypothetical protein
VRLLTAFRSLLTRAAAARPPAPAARPAPAEPATPPRTRGLFDSPGRMIRLGGRWYPSGRIFDGTPPGGPDGDGLSGQPEAGPA